MTAITRECGACTACCQGWLESIPLDIYPGKACQHLTRGGCGIYPDRPHDPCRKFHCGWKLYGSPMPEDMRPDQCGAIVVLGQHWKQWKLIRAVPVGWTFPEKTLKRIKNFAVAENLALIYVEFEQKDGVRTLTNRVGFGPPDFLAAFREALEQDDAAATTPPQFSDPQLS